jgi:hypothetical protein
MKCDAEIKTAISELTKSLEIIESIQHRSSIYDLQLDKAIDLNLLKYYIHATLKSIKHNFLLSEEDLCSIENLLDEMEQRSLRPGN